MAPYNNYNDNYAGIINALQNVRRDAGETSKYYPPNYQGIIDAINDMSKDWAGANPGEDPPGWIPETDGDGNVIGGNWAPGYQPPQGDLWFDERQGRLMVYVDDAYYQTNGADVLTKVQTDVPSEDVPGALWYNPDTTDLYVWDGDAWILLNSVAVSTATLPLENPSTFSAAGVATLPPSDGLATQADYNNWTYNSLVALDGEAGGAQVSLSSTPPTEAEQGDLWYNTTSLELLVRYDQFWVPSSIPLATDPNFIGLATKVESNHLAITARTDSALSRIEALEQEEHKSYSLETSPINQSIKLVDEVGVTTEVEFTGDEGLIISVDEDSINFDVSPLRASIEGLSLSKADKSTTNNLTSKSIELGQRINSLESASHVSVSEFNALSDAVSILPSQVEVDSKLAASGGDMTGPLNMGNNRIGGLSGALHPNDAVRNAEFIAFQQSVANNYMPKGINQFNGVEINRDDVSIPGVKITGGAAGGRRAFQINSNRATNAEVIFGQTDHAGEMAWQFDSGENFSWIDGTAGKQLRIDSTGVVAKDLSIGNFLRDGFGNELVMNKIDVKERLETYQTALAGVRSALNSSATFDDFKQSALTALAGI